MSRNVGQTWSAGVRRGEKSSPSGGHCCAKAERLERVCLVPRNKKKFITEEGKSARRSVARDEGRHRQEQAMQSLPGLSKLGFSIVLWGNEKPLQGKEVIRSGGF